jgi:hypothetical protein
MKFLAPPQATFLCMILGVTGIGIGSSAGSWIAIGAIAIRHGGWSAVRDIPKRWVIFPAIPDWFRPAEVSFANALVAVLLLIRRDPGSELRRVRWWRQRHDAPPWVANVRGNANGSGSWACAWDGEAEQPER